MVFSVDVRLYIFIYRLFNYVVFFGESIICWFYFIIENVEVERGFSSRINKKLEFSWFWNFICWKEEEMNFKYFLLCLMVFFFFVEVMVFFIVNLFYFWSLGCFVGSFFISFLVLIRWYTWVIWTFRVGFIFVVFRVSVSVGWFFFVLGL